MVQLEVVNRVTQYLYDEENQLLERIRSSVDTLGHDLQRSSRDSFAYDTTGFQILSQFDIWNRQRESWEVSLRIEREPNDRGFISQSLISFQDDYQQMLIPTSRLVYDYLDESTGQGADSLLFHVKNYVFVGNVEIPDYQTNYYYTHDQINPIQEHTSGLLYVYPNPAIDMVSIYGLNESYQYSWLDMNGRLIKKGETSSRQLNLPEDKTGQLLILQIHLKGQPERYSFKVLTGN